jgi:hypothetical protein
VTPAGSAKFGKTDSAAIYFEIYEPGLLEAEPEKGLQVAIQVRAFDSKGAARFDSGSLRVAMPDIGGNPSLPLAVGIPVVTLPPGTYRIEVSAIDSLNNKLQRSTSFEVQ